MSWLKPQYTDLNILSKPQLELGYLRCLLLLFVLYTSVICNHAPPPTGHSGELNTNQVLKTVNFPTPGAKLLVKPLVWQGLTHSHIHLKPYEVLKILRQYNMKIVTVNIASI